MKTPISITAIASISPLGISKDEIWANYQKNTPCFTKRNFSGTDEWIAPLQEFAKKEIDQLKNGDAKYRNLDDSVLFALYASRKAVEQAGWSLEGARAESGRGARDDIRFGINIGSSRGATTLFEKYHEEFLKDKRASTLSSPTTTLGNISSWVAHDLQTKGPEISHSITCSTALHALLNGVAWIKSGMADQFLVGGSEAPLTPFTIAQMKALKIYATCDSVANQSISSETERGQNQAPERPLPSGAEISQTSMDGFGQNYPCQALNLTKKQNTMILGEGASVACLEKGIHENTLAVIEGIGYATEPLRHNTSISTDAECFQRSMRMALGKTKPEEVDIIVMHAPGTIKGDLSEYRAIVKVFCNKLPFLTTNKWKIGHTFGTSGMLSLEMALLMLQHQQFIEVPCAEYFPKPKSIQKIIVNAVGFGGNAVSILLGSV
ncbi:3-oxoacyl-(acyl-carrier-protein) synthase [Pricia antarctica]|uniref:3-oxoacyl-(Acyl-carrier-protein) synthase n=1 Tax=Pricia antarctica TaxID=641691 RepID=A0A1G6W415_9FLAO|nr:beta-ketoacyl synthase N-terminal-like domain-containing protein [Pricia antarctica]SDD60622.1 3-oxoacyl-(acyl-carrier-protein) synthase [Pricia antarctica]